MRRIVFTGLAVFLTVLMVGEIQAEKRVTGIIGNSNHELISPLTNLENDARLVADTLRDVGFEPGDEFKDCEICPQMVVLPAGSFAMGLPDDELGDQLNEGPQHQVTVSQPFAVGKFEVTFAEWDVCVADGGCSYSPRDMGWGRGQQPAIRISWDDAKTYVQWLSATTGERYRLLSEAEWEYAARAGTRSKYWWGTTASHEYANYGKDVCCWGSASGQDQWVNTAPVGSFAANAFGLHDMHGNVSEWVEDCWYFYASDPVDSAARTSGADCRERIYRGGSHRSPPRAIRSTGRDTEFTDVRFVTRGFRVARALGD
jgi:formylglycine-generating enzyme required for sulfatase activity